jgi:hypothetical protein
MENPILQLASPVGAQKRRPPPNYQTHIVQGRHPKQNPSPQKKLTTWQHLLYTLAFNETYASPGWSGGLPTIRHRQHRRSFRLLKMGEGKLGN